MIRTKSYFNLSRRNRDDKFPIIDDSETFGSNVSLGNNPFTGNDKAGVVSEMGATPLKRSVVSRRWGPFHIFPDAARLISRRVNGFWSDARSHLGLAVRRLSSKKRRTTEIWIARVTTESVNPSNGLKEEKSFEYDFDSKEEAELHAYRWHGKILRPNDELLFTYKARIYLKGSDPDGYEGNQETASGTVEDAWIKESENGAVNPDYYALEAQEEQNGGYKIEEVK